MRGIYRAISLLLMLGAGLAGCAGTEVNRSHPLVAEAPGDQSAKVYFIRPQTERYLGVADNAITVEADRVPLLEMAKGEYALMHMAPGAMWVTVRNLTSWGPGHDIKEMSRSKGFDLVAGQTYFIVMEAVDGEFRGVHFEPREVDIVRAEMLTRHLRAVGEAGEDPIGEP